MRQMELLAPAGNMECLKAAVQNGADAVYFAGRNFGARSFADNFSDDDIREALDYCHLRGIKAHITVNTTVLDRELKELQSYLYGLIRAGADAFIVQDLGVLRLIRELSPDAVIHASTQMTIHNLAGVQALEGLGAERIVVSRELSQENLRWILKHCRAEVEVFAHGAMCMSYSGQCYMSSVLGGRSGNRGKCAQPCRLPYRGTDGKERFYLSLKDMSLIRHLEELRRMGVASLKIEGRMKGPAYVAAVVRTYRRCLDEGRKPIPEEEKMLDRIFFRGGLSDGYFKAKTGPAMFAFEKPDNPYQMGGAKIQKELLEGLGTVESRRIPLSLSVQIRTGSPIYAVLSDGTHQIEMTGKEIIEAAESLPTIKETVINQLSKTGGTPFVFEKIDVEIEGAPYVPARELNQLRRMSLETLSEALLRRPAAAEKGDVLTQLYGKLQDKRTKLPGFRAMVLTIQQYKKIRNYPFDKIYVPMSLLMEYVEFFVADRDKLVILPAAVIKDDLYDRYLENLEILYQNGFQNLCVQNIGETARRNRYQLFGGFRLNVSNSLCAMELKEAGLCSLTLSPELNLAQISGIQKCLDMELLAYGRLPLMLTENCITKNIGGCPCSDNAAITDRKGMSFPLVKDDDQCRSVLLNAVPTYMADKLDDLKRCGAAFLTLSFTTESPETCAEICEAYFNGIPYEIEEYTRLHFYKGVL